MGSALKRFYVKSYEDGITGLAGMVAYNLVLSLLPLTLLALFVSARLLQTPSFEAALIDDLHRLVPSTEDQNLTGLFNGIRRSSTTLGIAAFVSTIWVGASFWGSLDTAFCRIYRRPCRSWLRQKRFSLLMLVWSIALLAALVAVPALQGAALDGPRYVPFLLAVVGVLFVCLCVIYHAVPHGPVPWHGVWPGALGSTVAMTALAYAFPLYLDEGSALSTIGGTYVLVLIALVWFYVLALVLLAGAVVNALWLREAEPARS